MFKETKLVRSHVTRSDVVTLSPFRTDCSFVVHQTVAATSVFQGCLVYHGDDSNIYAISKNIHVEYGQKSHYTENMASFYVESSTGFLETNSLFRYIANKVRCAHYMANSLFGQ